MSDQNEAEVKARTAELNECLLSQYQATVAGLLAGGSISLAKKPISLLPAFTAGVAGSFIDLAYGYNVACASQVEAANRALRRPGYD
mmetsp:Transcript_22114/g.46203  ORF Transcript_22114/g.46203 Transcript_22114/m.46203 type:complete len:87 (-) Transcript_22114:84-344(-)